uniref:Uncharacterized protein n=1 Tax=Arundo donax TaxID=35708 RepID=A0A0A9BD69_ARUDO
MSTQTVYFLFGCSGKKRVQSTDNLFLTAIHVRSSGVNVILFGQ